MSEIEAWVKEVQQIYPGWYDGDVNTVDIILSIRVCSIGDSIVVVNDFLNNIENTVIENGKMCISVQRIEDDEEMPKVREEYVPDMQ